ncbi:MAG TPA: RluA family pseudouridine synthase [Candidatus Scatovivens faecipullorum]|nr:RluA family pseudouridine synthase [Candidatus Scatovivens faecipullorum]
MRKLIVNKKYDNKKLNNFILDSFPDLNKSTLYKALRKKDVRINNVKVSEDTIVHYKDEIVLYIIDELLFKTSNLNINIVYEDNNIIIFNKPEGISITDDNNSTPTFTSLVKQKYGSNLNPCHRLDRNTKGLIIYAKNPLSLQIMQEKFKCREIEKHYLAKVYGIINKNHEILEAYLFKDSKKSLVYISDFPKKDYSKIITEYTVIEKNKKENYTILDINLHTGKTHQIRAHLSHIGYPIIGDGKYGINEINKKFNSRTQELYSYKLEFNFKTDSGILNYLNKKVISLKIKSL